MYSGDNERGDEVRGDRGVIVGLGVAGGDADGQWMSTVSGAMMRGDAADIG